MWGHCFHQAKANPSTHWGQETHICISELTIIGSDNDLSPGRRQAIIWTNAGILLIGRLETNFSEILIKIHIFSFAKKHLKMLSGKWLPCCLSLNMLTPDRYGNWFRKLIFKQILLISVFSISCCISGDPFHVNIGLGNCLVLSDTEPMLN